MGRRRPRAPGAGDRIHRYRPAGLIVAGGYALALAYVATTPRRGLTPPPGQSAPAIDPGSVLVAIAFLVATILIVLGKADRRPGSSRVD